MQTLRISLLGGFAASTGIGAISIGPREAQLLAYMALRLGEPIPRVRAAGAIWPDHPETRAKANLSTTLWRLRLALSRGGCSASVLKTSATSLSLDAQTCALDVDEFRRGTPDLLSTVASFDGLARVVQALDLYRGDLLPEWDFEWCSLEREELRQRYLWTLRIVSRGFEARARYDVALQFARKAVAEDPFDEDAQRAVIRLLSLLGERTTAVVQFNKFAQLARIELGVGPSKETVALLGQIQQERAGQANSTQVRLLTPVVSTEGLPIVGREEERSILSVLMDKITAGTGGGALMVGEIGTGKTRLVNWALEEWASRGGRLGLGRCVEFNEPVPYQPVFDALSGVIEGRDASTLIAGSDMAPHMSSSDSLHHPNLAEDTGLALHWSARKLGAFARLCDELASASRERPLLLVIEDIQWADAGTVDWLAYVLEHASKMRVGLLLTSRLETSTRHCKALERLRRHCVIRLRLGPLSRPETARFMQLLLREDQVPRWLSDWIYDDTEGNPLFVLETIRLFHQRNAGRFSGLVRYEGLNHRGADTGGQEIPEGVRQAVEQRLALLDKDAHRVAQVGSVLGRSFDEEMLDLMVHARGNKLVRALNHLVRTGIFEREGGKYHFTHDKLRAVCYESMPLRLRRAMHARVAAALERRPDTPLQQLAWHQDSAGSWEMAAKTWELAGDHAMRVFASEEALSAYRHAVSCLGRSRAPRARERDEEEIRLFLKLDAVLGALGRPVERGSCLDRVRELCSQAHLQRYRPVWYLRRASLEEHVGNFRASSLLSQRAWFLAVAIGDKETEVEALRSLAWALNRSGRHGRSSAVSRMVLRRLGDNKSPTLVSTLWQAAAVHAKLSEYPTAVSLLNRAEKLANTMGLARELYFINGVRAVIAKWTGEIAASRAGFVRAFQMASEAGDRIGQARALFQIATLDAYQGDLGASLRKLRRAITLSRLTGYTRTYLACLNNVGYGVGRLLGNYRWAWRAVSHALRLAETSGSTHLVPLCKDSQILLLIEQGRPHEAMVLTESVLRPTPHDSETMGPNQESLTRRGVIWINLGDYRRAVQDLEIARRRQRAIGERLILVDTLTYLAFAYMKMGDPRALPTSEEAIRVLREIDGSNMQPQRVFWNHFKILEHFNIEPRLHYLKHAVDAIQIRGSALSRAQQRRFRTEVPLNRTILEEWERAVNWGLTSRTR